MSHFHCGHVLAIAGAILQVLDGSKHKKGFHYFSRTETSGLN